jgi:hypothetical protein
MQSGKSQRVAVKRSGLIWHTPAHTSGHSNEPDDAQVGCQASLSRLEGCEIVKSLKYRHFLTG